MDFQFISNVVLANILLTSADMSTPGVPFIYVVLANILLTCILSLATLAVLILMGIWTYRDAKEKELNPVLWTAVVVLVPGFIGIIIYLIIRTDAKKVTCSKCMKRVNGSSKFCSQCGVELIPVIEETTENTELKKSQKKVLIGMFSGMGVVVICTILTIIIWVWSAVYVADSVVNMVMNDENYSMIMEQLDSIDEWIGDGGISISVDGDSVDISLNGKTNKGNVGNGISEDTTFNINVSLEDLQALFDKYDIDYTKDGEYDSLEEAIRALIEEMEKDKE